MTTPLLSVIIPAFNAEAYLATALDSVVSQSDSTVEIIVVDDGSTDATAAIAVGYGQSVRLIQQLNRGTAAARNAGIAVSTGEWIAFLDADDYWLPQFWTVVRSHLEREVGVDVWVTGWQAVSHVGSALALRFQPRPGVWDQRRVVVENHILIHAAVTRRDLLISQGGFHDNFVEDWDLWVRLSLAGARFFAIPEVLVAYRLLEVSRSRNHGRVRSVALALIDRTFNDPRLDSGLQSLHRRARSAFLVQLAASYLAAGDIESGTNELLSASKADPAILCDEETWFALTAKRGLGEAVQPASCLEFAASSQQLGRLLKHIAQAVPLDSRHRSQAQATLHRATMKMARTQKCRILAMRHWARWVMLRPDALLNGDAWLWLLRSAISR